MNTRVILLDMDGVILKHPKVSQQVAQRCVKYVGRKLSIDSQSAHKLNKFMYHRFGHTLLGLERLYDYPLQDMIPEFNKQVYPTSFLEQVLETTRDDPEWKTMQKDWNHMMDMCQKKNLHVNVFSNAPFVWCRMVFECMNVKMDAIDMVFSSGDDVMSAALKPQQEVYENVFRFLQHVHRDSYSEIYFVDDNFHNLMPVIDQPYWRPIYMNAHDETIEIQNQYVKTIRSLRDIDKLL
jgi:FMN phosphatase YigB (HAD superfamily)